MSAAPLLQVESLWKRFGERVTAAGVNLDISGGEFFTMLGPSGSGKSTILRMIAGLEQPDEGTIRIAGQDVTRTPPWRRELGMVFQQFANFPHMTVAQNVAYGLRRQPLAKTAIRERVAELLTLVSLASFENRPVTRLSGGEQQRVAIARALAPRPRLLLLDEPLSALDEKIRREMQVQLKDIQRATKTTFIYVTHDQEEALTMSDRVAVLNLGHLVQIGEPHALFRRPRTKFVARFFRSSNVVEGELIQQNGAALFRCPSFEVAVPSALANLASPAAVAIRGEDVRLNAPGDPGDLEFEAVLERMTYRGAYTEYALRLPDGQPIAASATAGPDLPAGEPVRLSVRHDAIVPLYAEPTSAFRPPASS